MEERKRRIMRKYLRERMDITYSETVVPEASAEDEEVLSSEKFQEPQVDIQRHELGRALPPPVLRPVPPAQSRNWLLAEDPGPPDPYDGPSAAGDSKEELKKTDWTVWGTEREASPYTTTRESRFSWRDQGFSFGQQSGGYDSTRQQGIFDPRGPSAGDVQSGFPQQQANQPFGLSAGSDLSREKTFFTPALNQERPQSPFPHETKSPADQSFGSGLQPRTSGHMPYKSPYQAQREQRQRGYNDPEQEYQRLNTFQQWKKKNQLRRDPMSDDAFIEETMPKIRR